MKIQQNFITVWLLCVLMCSQPYLVQGEEEHPFVILNCPTNSGFFAIFSSVLAALDRYDQGNYAGIKVDLNSGLYLDPKRGPNWWEYFFEPIRLGDPSSSTHVLSFDETAGLINAGLPMSRERGFELIQKYVHLKPNLQKQLDKLVKKRFKDYFVIGMHYRGTDKKLEASLVPHHKILVTLNWLIANLSKTKKVKIFVATDEHDFITFLSGHYPGKVIYNDFVRSKNGEPVHYSISLYSSNYQKGKEALFDCLLLSKCDYVLFHAASAFGMAVVKFNAQLPAIALTGD